MKRRTLTVWLVACTFLMTCGLALAEDAKEKAIKKDRMKIKGTWQVVSLVINGNESKQEDVSKLQVVNGSDGTWALHSEGKVVAKGTSTIDPTKRPKTLDFVITEGGGAGEGDQYLGIYQLGNKARKMCFRGPGKDRPTEFVSTAENEVILVKFERIDGTDAAKN